MSSFVRRAAAVSLLLAAAGCADRPLPLEPEATGRVPLAAAPGAGGPGSSLLQGRHERLARRLAIALRDPSFRATVFQTLQRSPLREGKVHLQRFLTHEQGRNRHRLSELSAESEAAIGADLDASGPIEVYLPVPEHRRRWGGDANVLVATAEGDHDVPVAYDVWGQRRLLDPNRPPGVPVIALGRAEVDFAAAESAHAPCITCDEDPGALTGGTAGGGAAGGGGAGAVASGPAGLYMTYAKFSSTFEGWLKGDPEFEVHILGQDGTSSSMKSYQCAGEKAGGPYAFDQNSTEWSGSVLLFSQAQLDAYQAEHPGQSVRVFVLEDDDTACQIKMDSTRVAKLFQQLVQTYGTLTGGKDDKLFSVKTFTKAVSLLNLFRSAWSVITTQDDVVGNAIEDSVAGEFWPGANWIVKGENTVTNGAIRLELR